MRKVSFFLFFLLVALPVSAQTIEKVSSKEITITRSADDIQTLPLSAIVLDRDRYVKHLEDVTQSIQARIDELNAIIEEAKKQGVTE